MKIHRIINMLNGILMGQIIVRSFICHDNKLLYISIMLSITYIVHLILSDRNI